MASVYELLYISALQDSDTARAGLRDRVTKLLQDGGATVVAAREFARQQLSYPIKKQRAGEYTVVEFSCVGTTLASIQRELRLMPEMLRILVTEKVEAARPMGQEIAMRERARSQEDAAKAVVAERAAASAAAPAEPVVIEDLDKKLEEILGKEMV